MRIPVKGKLHKLPLHQLPQLCFGVRHFRTVLPGTHLARAETSLTVGLRLVQALHVFAFAQLLQSLVDGDPRQPSGKLGGRLELSDVLKGFQESVLRAVFGVLAIASDADQGAVDASLMAPDQPFESVGVPALHPGHQTDILIRLRSAVRRRVRLVLGNGHEFSFGVPGDKTAVHARNGSRN